LIKSSKEEVVKAINVSASKLKPNATSIELLAATLDTYNKLEKQPVRMAIEYIKQEARKLY